MNDSCVKIVKFKGEFEWHHHVTEDELFLVLKGRFRLCLRAGDLMLEEGELTSCPAVWSTNQSLMRKFMSCSLNPRPP